MYIIYMGIKQFTIVFGHEQKETDNIYIIKLHYVKINQSAK